MARLWVVTVVAAVVAAVPAAATAATQSEEKLLRFLRAAREEKMAKMDSRGEEFPSLNHEPEIEMSAMEIIKRWNYPVEEHKATTEDGYILTMQRITGPRRSTKQEEKKEGKGEKPVLFLMHGLLASAFDWIGNLPEQSFAFLAADAGFDVWLGNARGNTYSRAHTSLTPKQSEFWEFTFDEIAAQDVPTMVDYVLQWTKKEQLYYAGHSQGSMVMFAKGSEDPEFAKKIKKFFALAPVTTMGHVEGFGRKLSWWVVQMFLDLWEGEFMPSSFFYKKMGEYICQLPVAHLLCDNILFMIAGTDTAQLNTTRLPVYTAHTPAGTSRQNMAHYGQMIGSGKFQKFDYDKFRWFTSKNMAKYGSKTPPLYDVTKMEVPTVLFSGGKDILADAIDVKGLVPKLKNLVAHFHDPELDHLDYIWGLTSAESVYKPIIQMIADEEI